MRRAQTDLHGIGEGFSNLAAHRTLLAIRNGYLSILPYVIVMAIVTVIDNVCDFAGINNQITSYVDHLAAFILELFPEVILLSLTWHLNSHDRIRAPAIMLISLLVFWILCGWSQLMSLPGPHFRGQDSTIAIFPAIVLTHYAFKIFSRERSLSGPQRVVMSQMITLNLRYVIPGVAAVICAIVVRLLFEEFSRHYAPGIYEALINRIPYNVEVILFVMFLQVLSLFSIHGYATMLGVYEYLQGKSDILNLPSPEFFTLYATPGGAGSVFCLMLVMLVVNSRREYKSLAKISAPLTLFNISETLVFGIPLVFNPRMAWAFIAVPTVNATIAYTAMSMGWVEPQPNSVHWALPVFASSYIAFGGLNIPSMLLQLICLVCGVSIYTVAWRRYVRRERSTENNRPEFPLTNDPESAFSDNALDIVLTEESTNRWSRIKQADRTLRWLKEGHLHLVFQPIMDVRTMRIKHVEALLRFRDKNGILHRPRFLNILRHHSSVMEGIECWVIRNASIAINHWEDLGFSKRLFINTTPLFFSSPSVRKCFYNALNDCPVNSIGVEITEQSLLRNIAGTVADIEMFQGMDVQFALDDFGSGYSSFSYLSQLTVDYVKLDKSLIKRVTDPRQAHVVESIHNLCRTLEMQVIIEGVDDEQKMQFLQNIGVDLMQGYFLHRPMESAELEALLRQEQQAPTPPE
ncbi:EAL domain-containing protein [Halomonas sp. V046]|uniref:EAL domain-containing protein n=1 Tax=Halomonas sp. V046 TaxID=3459611 RepID=UPI0040449D01